MSHSLKTGLLLLVVIAVVGGAGYFIMQDEASTNATTDSYTEGDASRSGDQALGVVGAPESSDLGFSTDVKRDAESLSDGSVVVSGTKGPTAAFLRGQVMDPQRHPVVNAEITLDSAAHIGGARVLNWGRSWNNPASTAQDQKYITTTGSDGSFEIRDVPQGVNLNLQVNHAEYARLDKDNLVVPTRGMDLGVLTVEPGAVVSGTVFGPGGAPLSGAEVWFEFDENETPQATGAVMRVFRMNMSRERSQETAKSDERGRFQISRLKSGSGAVHSKTDEHPQGNSSTIRFAAGEHVRNVDVSLNQGLEIKGLVCNPAGSPVKGAQITVRNSDFNNFIGFNEEDEIRTDEQGQFAVPGLSNGRYDVTAQADGFAVGSAENVEAGTTELLRIELAATGSILGRVVAKNLGTGIGGFQLFLNPWSEGFQNLNPFMLRGQTPVEFETGVDVGAFLVPNVEPGEYVMIAKTEEHSMGYSEHFKVETGKSVDGLTIALEMGAVVTGRVLDQATNAPLADAEVTLIKEESEATRGRVQFAPGVRRMSRSYGFGGGGSDLTRHATTTNAKGEFVLRGIGAGTFALEVKHEAYAMTVVPNLILAVAEQKDLKEIVLGPGGSLEGNIFGADGLPKMGDRIDARSPTVDAFTFNAISDADGYYYIDHMPAGEYSVERADAEPMRRGGGDMVFLAMAAGGNEGPQGKQVVIREGHTERINFSLAPKPALEGVVSCAAGSVAGAEVSVQKLADAGSGGMPFWPGANPKATTDADGNYRIENLDPGNYKVRVRHPDGIAPFLDEVALQDSTARKDFYLEGGVIEGTVRSSGPNGEKVKDASVTIERVEPEGSQETSGQIMMFGTELQTRSGRGRASRVQRLSFGSGGNTKASMTDGEGRYVIRWVPPGQYRVVATHPGYLLTRSDPVELQANKTVKDVDVKMLAGGSLQVKVVSPETNRPIARQAVSIEGGEQGNQKNSMQITNEDGIARFDSLEPGDYTVKVHNLLDGASSGNERTVVIRSGETTEAEFTGN